MKAKGTTIIYTTHYMEEAESICDRIAIIDRGDIIALGTKEMLANLIEECSTLQVTVREISKVEEAKLLVVKGVERVQFEGNVLTIYSRREVTNLDQIIAVLIQGGAELTDIHMKELNLEDVFLNLTGRALRD